MTNQERIEQLQEAIKATKVTLKEYAAIGSTATFGAYEDKKQQLKMMRSLLKSIQLQEERRLEYAQFMGK